MKKGLKVTWKANKYGGPNTGTTIADEEGGAILVAVDTDVKSDLSFGARMVLFFDVSKLSVLAVKA